MNNRRKKFLLASVVLLVVFIVTLYTLSTGTRRQPHELETFSNSWFSIGYPYDYSNEGVFNNIVFLENKNDENSDLFRVKRLTERTNVKTLDSFLVGLPSDTKKRNESIGGKDFTIAEYSLEGRKITIYYTQDEMYVWSIAFETKSDRSDLEKYLLDIISSFQPNEDNLRI